MSAPSQDSNVNSASSSCPFCTEAERRAVHANAIGLVLRDAYPVSEGHTLIVPRRHVASFFDLERDEQAGLLDLLIQARGDLTSRYRPAGFNIGINDGPTAGQTVPHVHIHLIPRYDGDVPDPRGGVRWLLPERAQYW